MASLDVSNTSDTQKKRILALAAEALGRVRDAARSAVEWSG
jgi:hypothetical protein